MIFDNNINTSSQFTSGSSETTLLEFTAPRFIDAKEREESECKCQDAVLILTPGCVNFQTPLAVESPSMNFDGYTEYENDGKTAGLESSIPLASESNIVKTAKPSRPQLFRMGRYNPSKYKITSDRAQSVAFAGSFDGKSGYSTATLKSSVTHSRSISGSIANSINSDSSIFNKSSSPNLRASNPALTKPRTKSISTFPLTEPRVKNPPFNLERRPLGDADLSKSNTKTSFSRSNSFNKDFSLGNKKTFLGSFAVPKSNATQSVSKKTSLEIRHRLARAVFEWTSSDCEYDSDFSDSTVDFDTVNDNSTLIERNPSTDTLTEMTVSHSEYRCNLKTVREKNEPEDANTKNLSKLVRQDEVCLWNRVKLSASRYMSDGMSPIAKLNQLRDQMKGRAKSGITTIYMACYTSEKKISMGIKNIF